jgi:signal peptidase I
MKITTNSTCFIFILLLSLLTGVIISQTYESSKEILIPHDIQDEITGFYDKINKTYLIEMGNHQIIISTCKNTGSMYPTIGDNTTVLLKKDIESNEIKKGDIISFKTEHKNILHRVINTDEDEKGLFFITKGDNNMNNDFGTYGKIRPDQIRGVVIGIIY